MCVCVCVYVQDECLCMVVWNRIWKALLDMKHVGLIIKRNRSRRGNALGFFDCTLLCCKATINNALLI